MLPGQVLEDGMGLAQQIYSCLGSRPHCQALGYKDRLNDNRAARVTDVRSIGSIPVGRNGAIPQ